MPLESKDILQIDATIIAGILILLSITSSIPVLARVSTNPEVTTGVAGAVIFFFAFSAFMEIWKHIAPIKKDAKKIQVFLDKQLSLWFMLTGFIFLMVFGYMLLVAVNIAQK